jgi:hypothetical protein
LNDRRWESFRSCGRMIGRSEVAPTGVLRDQSREVHVNWTPIRRSGPSGPGNPAVRMTGCGAGDLVGPGWALPSLQWALPDRQHKCRQQPFSNATDSFRLQRNSTTEFFRGIELCVRRSLRPPPAQGVNPAPSLQLAPLSGNPARGAAFQAAMPPFVGAFFPRVSHPIPQRARPWH